MRHLVPEGIAGFVDALDMSRIEEARLADSFRNGYEVHLKPGAGDLDFTDMTGIDISETMIAEARAFNRALVDAGRVAFHLASVDAIPSADDTFDRGVSVNTFYFWPDPVGGLGEIRRVLRPEGVVMTASITPESAVQFAFMRHGFRLYDEALLREMHSAAGFRRCDVQLHRTKTVNLAGASIQYEHFLVRGFM